LDAGVHFGHQTKKWNPKMKRYIHGEKNGIYVIDLEKTVQCLERARRFLVQTVAAGGEVLFVGTKPQAQAIIRDTATATGMFYVHERWLGGLLTNFQTIRKSVRRYIELTEMKRDGTFEKMTKKEVSILTKEMAKFEKNFAGISSMGHLPAALVVVDATHEIIAVKEALRLEIPVVALVDTNADPDLVSYPIPSNDDAIRSIRILLNQIAEAIQEGKAARRADAPAGRQPEPVGSAGRSHASF
jgi:small subunit ribosomal protein S2